MNISKQCVPNVPVSVKMRLVCHWLYQFCWAMPRWGDKQIQNILRPPTILHVEKAHPIIHVRYIYIYIICINNIYHLYHNMFSMFICLVASNMFHPVQFASWTCLRQCGQLWDAAQNCWFLQCTAEHGPKMSVWFLTHVHQSYWD